MNLIRLSIDRPIAVISAVVMVVLFGWLALTLIPIQLTPDVNRPVITVKTFWPGAAPAEIEREITNRQEDMLKGINGLKTLESNSSRGQASVTLEFAVGTDMNKALLLVANRLDRVSGYPEEADEPVLSLAGSRDRAIAWFIITRDPDNTEPIHKFGDFLEDVVKDRVERAQGVSEVNIFGGSERQLQVAIKPESLARYGMTVDDVVTALRRANVAMSGGKVDEGKRTYIVRTNGELNSIAAVETIVLRSDRGDSGDQLGRVTVGQLADVAFVHAEPGAHIRILSEPALAFNVTRETGANVIETMRNVREAAQWLAEGPLRQAGLRLRQVYDETVYISSAVSLVQNNIWVGGILAAAVLLLFLRSWRATFIVAVAIPVSVIGSFVAMAAMGRSLNVISLAGFAFAVGMVVDAAIVVLENIYRLHERGVKAVTAAYDGALQVWGAVFVSALTTVMVFTPILVIDLEVGQLFRDIAVAISVSVILSLLVSITVLPALSAKLLARKMLKTVTHGENANTVNAPKALHLPFIDTLAKRFVNLLGRYARVMGKNTTASLFVVIAVSLGAVATAYTLLPAREYLPNGNRNLLFGVLVPPPGYNLETMYEIARRFEDGTRPLWAKETGPESAPGEPVKMDRFFFVATQSRSFIGTAAVDASRAHELVKPLNMLIAKDPDTLGGVSQMSLFGRGFGSTRQIDLDISGPALGPIFDTAMRAAARLESVLPRREGNSLRPSPALSLGAPELRITPDRIALSDAGVTAQHLGQTVDVFNDGMRVAEVTVDGNRIDLVLRGEKEGVRQTQDIASLPVVTPRGQIVPVSSLAAVELTAGPTQILHKERHRTVTLMVTPRTDIPLEMALDLIQKEVIDALTAQGLPDGVRLHLSGTADKLAATWSAMQGRLLVALIVVYLVMAILFESFLYPLVILLAVPLAAAGGVGGLWLLDQFVGQKLDMLTMLGFVILIGIVVNNAILLVHQTLAHIRRDGMAVPDAIVEATRNRVRPIFMSTLTSVFGMLPLVLSPGAGSELYRGLGSVVVGGLSLSALLTLFVVPPMMSLLAGTLEKRRQQR